MIHSSDHSTKISHQSKLQRISDSPIQLPPGQVALSSGDALNLPLPPTQLNDPESQRMQCSNRVNCSFTPSALRSTPSRRDGAPNGLLPRRRPALVAPPNRRGPTRNRLRSIANSHVSRHTPAPAPRFAFQPERRAENKRCQRQQINRYSHEWNLLASTFVLQQRLGFI